MINRIIPPLASRCIKFGYKPLPSESIKSRLQYICEQEHVQCDDDVCNFVL